MGFKGREARPHLLPYRLATRVRQRPIRLCQAARRFLEAIPVVVERRETVLACRRRHADLAKAGGRQEALETPSVRQRKYQAQDLLLVRQIPAEDFREDTPHRRALACGDDAHRGTTARAEHPAELVQALGGIGKEHEAELTEHGVEGAVSEWQPLTIRHDGSEA